MEADRSQTEAEEKLACFQGEEICADSLRALKPLVTILCLTYNHEDYVRRPLDSFLMQKTDFPVEILVHDDASTDATPAILREYAAAHPDTFHLLLQRENQFSQKDVPIMQTFVWPRVRSPYCALCEGDDWWTDPEKLQRQIGYLEAHPDCSIVMHTAWEHTMGQPKETDVLVPDAAEDYDLDTAAVIRESAGKFATNATVVRTQAYIGKPDAFYLDGVGDYPNYIYASLFGTMHVIARPMSVHNVGVEGSWTARIWGDPEKRLHHLEELCAFLERVDSVTEGRCHEAVAETLESYRQPIEELRYQTLKARGETEAARAVADGYYWKRDRRFAAREKLMKAFPGLFALKDKCPWLLKLKRKIFPKI